MQVDSLRTQLTRVSVALVVSACGGSSKGERAPEVVEPADPWQEPLEASSLPSLELNVGSSLSYTWPFANMLRSSEAWLAGVDEPLSSSDAEGLASDLEVDESGTPLVIPDGCELRIETGYVNGAAIDPETGEPIPSYLTGAYVLTWQGAGDVALTSSRQDGVGYELILEEPHRQVLRIDDASLYPIVRISSTESEDPVRDLLLWAPEADGAGLDLTSSSDLDPGQVEGSLEPASGQVARVYHPRFLEHHRGHPARVLRFMGWLEINDLRESEETTWDDRARPEQGFAGLTVMDEDYARHPVRSYRQRLGLPYETMIGLCNELGKDLWLQVPHTANDELIQQLARLVAGEGDSDGLDAGLRVWIEYSNELWNPSEWYAPQLNKSLETAAEHFEIPVQDVEAFSPEHAWGAGRLQGHFLQVFEDEWRELGQPDSRLVNVVSGFAANDQYNARVLESVGEVDAALPEVLAITHYFGSGTQAALFGLHDFGPHDAGQENTWPAELNSKTKLILRRDLYATAELWERTARVANDAGLPLVAYEGGQHLVVAGFGDTNDPAHLDFMRFVDSFQSTDEMGRLYLEMYALWNSIGGRTASHFEDVSPYGFYGYWGAKRTLNETREDSPKWDALLTWGELQEGVRAALDPRGTRPEFSFSELRGEVGTSFEADVTAEGGDGEVTLSLVAGELPPGVRFSPAGSGAGRLTGTPTAYGQFRPIVRARDEDGDVTDTILRITVDPEGSEANAMLAFIGSELPGTEGLDEEFRGRFDPMREQTLTGPDDERLVLPFSIADGDVLFGSEVEGGRARLDPQSALTMYGGWSVTSYASADAGSTPDFNPTSFVGLRDQAFVAFAGDTGAGTRFDLMVVWRRDQFDEGLSSGPYGFGADTPNSILLVHVRSLVDAGLNDLRFVILHRDQDGVDRWYAAEAPFVEAFVGGGDYVLTDFSDNDEPGRRWAPFSPSAEDVRLPALDTLDFEATTFNDVQAVGLLFHGERDQFHYTFSFDRFLACGEGP